VIGRIELVNEERISREGSVFQVASLQKGPNQVTQWTNAKRARQKQKLMTRERLDLSTFCERLNEQC
jgi:hypothetical protein